MEGIQQKEQLLHHFFHQENKREGIIIKLVIKISRVKEFKLFTLIERMLFKEILFVLIMKKIKKAKFRITIFQVIIVFTLKIQSHLFLTINIDLKESTQVKKIISTLTEIFKLLS